MIKDFAPYARENEAGTRNFPEKVKEEAMDQSQRGGKGLCLCGGAASDLLDENDGKIFAKIILLFYYFNYYYLYYLKGHCLERGVI